MFLRVVTTHAVGCVQAIGGHRRRALVVGADCLDGDGFHISPPYIFPTPTIRCRRRQHGYLPYIDLVKARIVCPAMFLFLCKIVKGDEPPFLSKNERGGFGHSVTAYRGLRLGSWKSASGRSGCRPRRNLEVRTKTSLIASLTKRRRSRSSSSAIRLSPSQIWACSFPAPGCSRG